MKIDFHDVKINFHDVKIDFQTLKIVFNHVDGGFCLLRVGFHVGGLVALQRRLSRKPPGLSAQKYD